MSLKPALCRRLPPQAALRRWNPYQISLRQIPGLSLAAKPRTSFEENISPAFPRPGSPFQKRFWRPYGLSTSKTRNHAGFTPGIVRFYPFRFKRSFLMIHSHEPAVLGPQPRSLPSRTDHSRPPMKSACPGQAPDSKLALTGDSAAAAAPETRVADRSPGRCGERGACSPPRITPRAFAPITRCYNLNLPSSVLRNPRGSS
jgi:hypothetical protein